MRTLASVMFGLLFGLAIGLTGIAAIAMLSIGVVGGWLVRREPGSSSVINYDPSTVASRAPLLGLAALILVGLFIGCAMVFGTRE